SGASGAPRPTPRPPWPRPRARRTPTRPPRSPRPRAPTPPPTPRVRPRAGPTRPPRVRTPRRPWPRGRRPTSPERRRPRRTCIGCRRVRAPDEMVRIARTEGGSLAVGRTLPGRGAWLCADTPSCAEAALRRGAVPRALRAVVAPEQVEAVLHRVAAASRTRSEPFDPAPPDARG